jgi:hypothetical protein
LLQGTSAPLLHFHALKNINTTFDPAHFSPALHDLDHASHHYPSPPPASFLCHRESSPASEFDTLRDRFPSNSPMFSPSVADGGPATATRSRRRQRPKSQDDIVQQPKAKRQRLPLTEQTFVNPDAPQEMAQIQMEKPAVPTPNGTFKHDNLENIDPTPRRDSSMRIKKPKHGDRAANKGDGSLVLVRQIPSNNSFQSSFSMLTQVISIH